MDQKWNPWHGCHKISTGCENCYVYRTDARYEKDSSIVTKTSGFDIPIRKKRNGAYKIKPGDFVYTCFTSDFLLEDADPWREMIRERSDVDFLFITKRIDRLATCVPADWGDGYENVFICTTVENQQMADYRLPIFRDAPICHKMIVCEPLLGRIDLSAYLGDWVLSVTAGGESGTNARVCDYDWILFLQKQCIENKIRFTFKQTGTYLLKDGKRYTIPRSQQHTQAWRVGINYNPMLKNQK